MNLEVESAQGQNLVKDSLLKDEVNLEKWRQMIRTRVKALKCHIMASKGMTADGVVGESYSPRKLLEEEIKYSELSDEEKEELREYVEVAMARIRINKVQESTSYDNSEVSHDDVQFTMELENKSSNTLDEPDSKFPNKTNSSTLKSEEVKIGSENECSNSHDNKTTCDIDELKRASSNDSNIDELNKTLLKQTKEIDKLSRIRDEVENELQDLTANLFQMSSLNRLSLSLAELEQELLLWNDNEKEANSMVLGANQRAAMAEKSLKEAVMQVEVLQAEVSALKALVITSTPSAPNPHLHPQIISRGAQAIAEAGKIFHRGHKKSTSEFDLKYGRETTPPSSPLKENKLYGYAGTSNGFPLDPECWEVDPILHKEFVFWRQNPVLSRDSPFMSRVYSEDIDLCLTFPNSTLAHKVNVAIEDNALYIEEVNPRQKSCPKKCVLLEVPRYCKYRFRLGDKDDTWYYISQLARNRIIAVCDFLNYLHYIQLGLVKSSIHDVYWEIVKLRRQMSMARLGF